MPTKDEAGEELFVPEEPKNWVRRVEHRGSNWMVTLFKVARLCIIFVLKNIDLGWNLCLLDGHMIGKQCGSIVIDNRRLKPFLCLSDPRTSVALLRRHASSISIYESRDLNNLLAVCSSRLRVRERKSCPRCSICDRSYTFVPGRKSMPGYESQ